MLFCIFTLLGIFPLDVSLYDGQITLVGELLTYMRPSTSDLETSRHVPLVLYGLPMLILYLHHALLAPLLHLDKTLSSHL